MIQAILYQCNYCNREGRGEEESLPTGWRLIDGRHYCDNHAIKVEIADATRRKLLPALFAAGLVYTACNDLPSKPTPIPDPIPEPPPDEPDLPITATIQTPFKCLTAFALGLKNDSHIVSFIQEAQFRGYNMLRVGSETRDWNTSGARFFRELSGPEPGSGPWEKDLRKVLTLTGQYGIAVELVASFTVKGRDARWQKDYVQRVASIAKKFPHVVLSAVNEWYVHSDLSRSDVIDLIHVLKSEVKNSDVLVTCDDNPRGGAPYSWELGREVDLRAFHPSRNPEPSKDDLRKAMGKHGSMVFFDETVAFALDSELRSYPEFRGAGTIAGLGKTSEEDRKRQVRKHINDMNDLGANLNMHSLGTIACNLGFWAPTV